MLKRRNFIKVLAASAISAPLLARAELPAIRNMATDANLRKVHKTRQANGIWCNARITPVGNPEQVLEGASIVVRNGIIVWIGSDTAMPKEFAESTLPRHDVGRRWITPGLIDCHTHLIYGSNRADEFSQLLAGTSYEEIARHGGGIVSTVRATRMADEESLFKQAAQRLESLLAEGVMAIEIKSGYGLDLPTERKMLRVARRLGEEYPVTVYTTFLGAHALPPEYKGRADAYIDLVSNKMLPTLYSEGLIDAVDVYCENIAFSVAQTEKVFSAARKLGLPVKIHAEQLSNMGATQLATRFKALSADHLEHLQEADVIQMKKSGTVAVLLPGASYFIRETSIPPVDLLRRYQIPVAIATNNNPGSSPTTSLLLMLNMSCTRFHLTTGEALMGVTSHAALALGKADRHGLLAVGRSADFVVWSIDSLAELSYWFGFNLSHQIVHAGMITAERGEGYR